MADVEKYLLKDGTCPFDRWFNRLNARAAFKVTNAIRRLEHGNTSNTQSVGAGVRECRINFGPGYRVYFGLTNQGEIIVLLGGGTKKRQSNDIANAKLLWAEYKSRQRKND